jgi:aryl-alcohol dehydrogenase-like predicted oxidoreductase
MRQSLYDSLRALRTDYLDIWQIHNVDSATLTHINAIAELFSTVKDAGQIRWTGASFYGPDLPVLALSTGAFDIMQVTYSVLDQRLSDRFFDAAAASGVGIIVRSVLLKGALTDRAEYLPQRLGVLRESSVSFRELVDQRFPGSTPAQVAIAFALANKQIDSVLVGVRSASELDENLKSVQIHMEPELLTKLRSLRLDDADLLNPGTWGIP